MCSVHDHCVPLTPGLQAIWVTGSCAVFFLLLLLLQGVDLQKLILAHNNLEVLREDLRNLSSLVVLNISHNRISSLPAAIGEYAHRPY